MVDDLENSLTVYAVTLSGSEGGSFEKILRFRLIYDTCWC
jgi:hypothetical protein